MSEQEMMNVMEESTMPIEMPTEMPAKVESTASTMLDSIKEHLKLDSLTEKVKHSKDKLFEAGLYAGIGFISGFLLKKYSTYVFVSVLLLIGLGVLQHLEVINVVVNWDKVNELFGIQAAKTVSADSLLSVVWEWVKLNMVISVSYAVGLFVGLKVG